MSSSKVQQMCLQSRASASPDEMISYFMVWKLAKSSTVSMTIPAGLADKTFSGFEEVVPKEISV